MNRNELIRISNSLQKSYHLKHKLNTILICMDHAEPREISAYLKKPFFSIKKCFWHLKKNILTCLVLNESGWGGISFYAKSEAMIRDEKNF